MTRSIPLAVVDDAELLPLPMGTLDRHRPVHGLPRLGRSQDGIGDSQESHAAPAGSGGGPWGTGWRVRTQTLGTRVDQANTATKTTTAQITTTNAAARYMDCPPVTARRA